MGTTAGKRIVHQVDTLWRVSSGCEPAKRMSTKHRLLERDPHGNTTRGGKRRRRHTAEHEGRVRWSRRRRRNKCVAGMSLRHLMIISWCCRCPVSFLVSLPISISFHCIANFFLFPSFALHSLSDCIVVSTFYSSHPFFIRSCEYGGGFLPLFFSKLIRRFPCIFHLMFMCTGFFSSAGEARKDERKEIL